VLCLLNTKSLSRDGFVTRNQAESERKKSVEIQDVEFFSLFTSAETERSIERSVCVCAEKRGLMMAFSTSSFDLSDVM
jgi:hypothetical protein